MPEIAYGRHGEERWELTEEEFQQGPPDGVNDDHYDPHFQDRSFEEKVRVWHESLCKTFSKMTDAEIKKVWQATGKDTIVPAYRGVGRVAIQSGRELPISMVDYRRGPADAKGKHAQYFDQMTPAQQKAEWAKADASKVPAIPKAAVEEANLRSSFHQSGLHDDIVMGAFERFSIGGVADVGWSKKGQRAIGAAIGGSIFAVLGAAAAISAWYFTKQAAGSPTTNPPDAPIDVKVSASLSTVTVSWNPPQTGGVISYQVTLTDQKTNAQTTVSDIPMLIFTMQDLADGTYVAQVVAVNANGSSAPAVSAPITTPAPESVDYNAAVDEKTLTDALQAFQDTTDLAHDDFWTAVIPVCTIDENGKQISYEDQLKLALYLALVLLNPIPPDSGLLDQYAAQIRKNAKPPFSDQPRGANDPYLDPVPLWTSASQLKNKLQTTVLPVRTQMFALIRCLEVYLGMDPETRTMSSQADVPGLVLNTSVMVAMAVPVVGPELAGALSVVIGLYEGAKKELPASWSIAQAIGDLGNQVDQALKNLALDDRLAKIQSWQKQAAKISTDILRASDSQYLAIEDNRETLAQAVTDFHNTKDYDEIFSWFGNLKDKEETRNLELYFTARAAYHSCCFLMLQLNALLEGGDLDDYAGIPNSIIDDFYRSLGDAIEYGKPKQEALDHAFKHSVEEALAKSIEQYPNPGVEQNQYFAKQLIAIRREAHLEVTSQIQVDRMAEFLAAFEVTQAYLENYTAEKQGQIDAANAAAAWAIVQAAQAKDRAALGKKSAKAVRFLYECSSTGEWVDVLSDSPLAPGSSVATQDAGSSSAGIYYKVGGGTLNKVFADGFNQSAQLTTVNAALAAAYDAKYGAGSYKADSAGATPRQDRLTSFVIPLAQESPVGDNVYAMVYSVGPQLTSVGILDRDGYKQIYLDAMTEIGKWNKNYPAAEIKNFRITMVSTGAYGTTAFMKDSAELILQAVKEAAKADPSLAGITILVNSNYKKNNPALEADAFAKAATAAGIKGNSAGFDLPLS